jgi:hypothetical protein
MKCMHEKDECHFHNKKKKIYCEEIELSESHDDYPMNDILNRIDTLESSMTVKSVDHIAKIQRVLIVVHFILYIYIVHLITDYEESNFLRSLNDYQLITTIFILKNFILSIVTSFYSYMLKNVNSSLSSSSLSSFSFSAEEIENMLMDYDESFSYNDKRFCYYNHSVH